jgi:hypothetical protein
VDSGQRDGCRLAPARGIGARSHGRGVADQNSAEAYLGTEFMTERVTYYPSLTESGRYRLTYRFDLDFNLPGDWYFRVGLFDNYDSKPPEGFSKNDYGWSNGFGFKF